MDVVVVAAVDGCCFFFFNVNWCERRRRGLIFLKRFCKKILGSYDASLTLFNEGQIAIKDSYQR